MPALPKTVFFKLLHVPSMFLYFLSAVLLQVGSGVQGHSLLMALELSTSKNLKAKWKKVIDNIESKGSFHW